MGSPPESAESEFEPAEEPVAAIRVAEAVDEQATAEVPVNNEADLTTQFDDSQRHLEEIISSIDKALEEAAPVLAENELRDKTAETSSQHERYLVFSLAGIKYAVPTPEVVEIGRVPPVTPVPNVPAWLSGVTNRRGDILSVVDLRRLLGVKGASQTDSARIVVVRSTGDELMTGMIVDHVNGMLNVAPGTVKPPAGPIDTGVTPYLVGLCEHKNDLVAVLDLELLLASPEMRQFELV
jgi:purine-binding chemotaxis protein CheW